MTRPVLMSLPLLSAGLLLVRLLLQGSRAEVGGAPFRGCALSRRILSRARVLDGRKSGNVKGLRTDGAARGSLPTHGA